MFARPAHISPTAHRHFEHAFELLHNKAALYWETAYEMHLDHVADPEWAATPEFRQEERDNRARMEYFEQFAYAYRTCLGPWLSDHRYSESVPF